MRLTNTANQQRRDYMYDASGTITSGGTAQLVLPQSLSRSFLYLKNTSSGPLSFEFGGARATATITSNAVTSVSITNAGFNYTKPPLVRFWGGGYAGNTSFLGIGQPGYPAPPNPATGHATLSGSTVGSVVVDNAGSAYAVAPYVQLINSDLDPSGCAVPSATVGIILAANESLTFNGTCCPTDAIGVFGATNAQAFVCKWMD